MGKRTKKDMISTYDKHKNLKIAAEELGMVWQTLYWNLCKFGHPVTGDKSRYGSPTDVMAKTLEDKFKELVPKAEDYNQDKFQAEVDFKVGTLMVDIKASTKKTVIKIITRRILVTDGHFQQKYRRSVRTSWYVFVWKGMVARTTERLRRYC